MTMHMIQGVNSTNTRKRKPQMTKRNQEKWQLEHAVYNKRQRQLGQPKVTLEQYIDIIHGRTPRRQTHTHETFTEYNPTYDNRPRRGSSTAHIKSLNTGGGDTKAAPKKEYTGDLVKGIGTMHKSNAVPVIDEQAMKDLASMRR